MALMIYQVLIIVGTLITKPICRNLLSFQWPPASSGAIYFSWEMEVAFVGQYHTVSPLLSCFNSP